MLATRWTTVPLLLAGAALAAGALAEETSDPFPEPIGAGTEALAVEAVEIARIPEVDGEPARMMRLVHEPGSDRLFLNDQRGPIYVVPKEGGSVTEYLDVADPEWGVEVDAGWREKGVQGIAFHPQFAEPDAPGRGRLYVWTDTRKTGPEPDFAPGAGEDSHDTVLLEFRAETPGAARYDGGPPRVLARFEQPYANHNGGDLAFDPLASPGDADYGLLYVGVGDGGSGGDPHDLARSRNSAFGKVLRIDPLGSDGRTGEYGIPPGNPFAGDEHEGTLDEIYALGLRNPQHLAWDPASGRAYVADIGQNTVEEVSPLEAGADLGWNEWEGSFRFAGGGVETDGARGDPEVTYPVAEYDHRDPLLSGNVAVTGLVVYRDGPIEALRGRILFGDLPSGELFCVSAEDPPEGGQAPLRRVLLDVKGGDGEAGASGEADARGGADEPTTLLELVRAKSREQGYGPASRVDLRLARGPDGRIFLLDKHDGTLRALVAPGD